MGVSKKGLLLLVLLSTILFSTTISAFQEAPADESQALTSSRVVFLEHSLLANGTVVSGEAPFRSVNFPNYWFNENTRQLNGNIDFAINNSLIAIFGDSLTLLGNFGAGTGNKLYGIYRLPVKANEASIYSIDRFGNVGMYVNNRTVILRPGENYTYVQDETVTENNGTVKIAYEHVYLNRGIIDKNAITVRMVE